MPFLSRPELQEHAQKNEGQVRYNTEVGFPKFDSMPQLHYLKLLASKNYPASFCKSLSHRRKPVSTIVLRYWVPAFARTTLYFPLSWQLLVMERKYLMLKADGSAIEC